MDFEQIRADLHNLDTKLLSYTLYIAVVISSWLIASGLVKLYRWWRIKNYKGWSGLYYKGKPIIADEENAAVMYIPEVPEQKTETFKDYNVQPTKKKKHKRHKKRNKRKN